IGSAKQYFSNKPTELHVTGDLATLDEANVITLKADPKVPNLLDLTIAGGGKTYNYTFEPGSLDRIIMNGGGGNDTYNFEDLPAGIFLDLDVGTANAAVNFGKAGVGTANILGGISIKGEAGASTRLLVDNQAGTGANATVTVSTGTS